MSTFKQKSLFAALAGLGVLGVVDSAQAVHVNSDGLGQALIYPYYTARSTASGNAYVTALTVVNTTASAKAVKVRFLEGKNSREVLDFNLYLSKFDVWTAGIVAAGAGAGIFTADNSCTQPKVSNSSANPRLFRNGAYIGDSYLSTATNPDRTLDGLDRTYEGYFEILEMHSIVSNPDDLQSSVTHSADLAGPNASKPSCENLTALAEDPQYRAIPSGGLMGSTSLINVNEGTDYSYDAVALDGWSDRVFYSSPGLVTPQLQDASPAASVVLENTPQGGKVVRTLWGFNATAARDAVSAVLMRNNVYNEYTVEPSIKAATDWVVTMPTKRFYVNTTSAALPFQSNFTSKGSCDYISLTYYDREEQSPGEILDFSPSTPDQRSLCWEANVLTFTGNGGSAAVSHVLQSTNVANVGLTSPWINGWANLSFPPPPGGNVAIHSLAAPIPNPQTGVGTVVITVNTGDVSPLSNATYFGLPIVGFAVQSYTNGLLPGGVLSNYGGNFNHRYVRKIQ